MDPSLSADWSLRELTASDEDYLGALHLAATAHPMPRTGRSAVVNDLLEGEQSARIQLRPLVAAYHQGKLDFAVVGVESPGASNLILVPFELGAKAASNPAAAAVGEAVRRSKQYGVKLCQVIGPIGEANWDAILRQAGLTCLTELIYLTGDGKRISARAAAFATAGGFRWISYSKAMEGLFCEAISLSYVQSQDCPELIDARSAEDMLRAHACVGEFDAANWFVLIESKKPVGVLLLSKVRREPVIEIVYMGVSQPMRGRGVADALLARAYEVATEKKARLILAVDARNGPAKKLYARWNFVEAARRRAWIANFHSVES